MSPFSMSTALAITSLVSFILSGFLLALARDRKLQGSNRSYLLLGLAYLANGLRVGVQLLAAGGVRDRLFLGDQLYVLFVCAIWLGVRAHCRSGAFSPRLLLVPAGMLLWVTGAHLAGLGMPWLAIPDHLAGGILFGLSGADFWNLRKRRRGASSNGQSSWEADLLAIMFWLQGLSTFTYPFSRLSWWAPYGFAILALLGTAIGLGMMIAALREEQRLLTLEIARRQEVEAGLRASEAKFHLLFHAAPVAIALSRLEDGTLLELNEACCTLAGVTRDEALGRTSTDLGWMTLETRGRFMQALEQEGRVRNLPLRFFARGTRPLDTLFSADLVQVGCETLLLSQVVDITERNRLERERAMLQAQIQQAQKMDSLGRLAGGVAHDMNNVLAAILGLASASLAQEAGQGAARSAFATIGKAAARGAEMVKGLLRFARQAPQEDRLLDLNELLTDVASILERTTLARVRLQLHLAESLRPVRGDAGALTGALINLCVNAVDAMDGQGTLTLETVNLDAQEVQVSIADTGCGMPREVLERATEPFFTTKPQGRGTGLGLPTACQAVQAHGGSLEIQSVAGKGTRVLLRFPASSWPAGMAPSSAAEAEPAPEPARLRVLVVDDDDLVRVSTEALLQVLGHACELAASGEDALARLEAGPAPDVVILDMNMPGLGGAGTLPRLRALHPGLPVLLATGRADPAVFDLVAAHPGTSLLQKPFSLDDLCARLARCAAGARQGPAGAAAIIRSAAPAPESAP